MQLHLNILKKLTSLQNLTITPDIDAVVNRLQGPLNHYAELEFRSDGKKIDLITLSNDPTVVQTFLELLRTRGMGEAEIAVPKALLRFGAGKVVGMKLPIAGSTTGGEIYIRGALPLGEVSYFLEQQGVKNTTIIQMNALAAIFEKGHTHMLAVDVASPPAFTLFFTSYLVSEQEHDDLQRLQQALHNVGMTECCIASSLNLHRLLGANRPKTLFFSWGILDGEPVPRAKIDYADVRLGALAEAMDTIGASALADVLVQWSMEFGLRKANYAGIVVEAAKPSGVRAYFTQRLSN